MRRSLALLAVNVVAGAGIIVGVGAYLAIAHPAEMVEMIGWVASDAWSRWRGTRILPVERSVV